MSTIRLPAAAAEALARGQLIEAVKIVRQASGLGLKEAHDLVQAYQQQASSGFTPAPSAMPVQPASPGGFVFPQEASQALARGEIINAIAALRRANPQLDLRSAKTAIDQFRQQGDIAKPTSSMPAMPQTPRQERIPTVVHGDSGGHTMLLVIVAAVIVAAAWWWFGAPG